ncbi:MAG: hypothetical protein ACRDD2_04070 [Sarcina sp.]
MKKFFIPFLAFLIFSSTVFLGCSNEEPEESTNSPITNESISEDQKLLLNNIMSKCSEFSLKLTTHGAEIMERCKDNDVSKEDKKKIVSNIQELNSTLSEIDNLNKNCNISEIKSNIENFSKEAKKSNDYYLEGLNTTDISVANEKFKISQESLTASGDFLDKAFDKSTELLK